MAFKQDLKRLVIDAFKIHVELKITKENCE